MTIPRTSKPAPPESVDANAGLDIDPARPLTLLCVSDPFRGRTFRLDRRVNVLGRSGNTTITVDDSSVSREHAVLEVAARNVVTVRDLGSMNGTRVNGRTISVSETVRLNAGDSLGFGLVTFKCLNQGDVGETYFHDELYWNSSHDFDTGLPNRTAFQRATQEQLDKARRSEGDLTLAFVEIESYSELGRRFGNNVSLHALNETIRIINDLGRARDLVGRFYDNVLGVLLPHTGDESGRLHLDKVRKAIVAHRFQHDGQDLAVRIRIKARSSTGSETSEEFLAMCLGAGSPAIEIGAHESAAEPTIITDSDGTSGTILIPVWSKVIKSIAALGCVRQAEQLAMKYESGQRRNELLNEVLAAKQIKPRNAIFGMLFHELTGSGIPCAPGLSMPSAEHSATIDIAVLESFQRAVGLAWTFLLHGSGATPPWRPALSEDSRRLLERTTGDSLELAFALDAMGAWCGVVPRLPIVVTGKLSETGAVLPVLHVREKIEGISREFSDTPVLFVVPNDCGLDEAPPEFAQRGHRIAFVSGLDDARRLAFGDHTLELRSDASVLKAVMNAADALLERDHDPVRALRLLSHLDLEALRAVPPGLAWAQMESRRGAAFSQASEWSRAERSFAIALPVTESRYDDLDRDQQARHSGYRILSFLNRCFLSADNESVTALESCLVNRRFGNLTLTLRELIEIRGALAAFHSRSGRHAEAVSYRRKNLLAHAGGDASTQAAATETWSRLIWDASRAGDFKLAEQAWLNATRQASDVGQWTAHHHARTRQLEIQGRFDELLGWIDRPRAGDADDEAAWLRTLNLREAFGYPICATRRVLGRALGERGRHEEAREFLECSLRETEAFREPVLAWHGELARIELALVEARSRSSRALALTHRDDAIERMKRLHAPSAAFYQLLIVALEAWEPGASPNRLRRAIEAVYL